MAALLKLAVTRWEAQAVLLPEGRGVRITVFGDWFPMRAIEPEILVGEAFGTARRGGARPAQHPRISARRAEGRVAHRRPLRRQPGGDLEERFSAGKIRPLPQGCT